MGVTGLWDILRPSGKLRSLTHIAVVDGFEANPANLRGLRIGIDASIWFFHAAHGREGENPELRTLFFRCAKLVKRGKRISGEKHWLVDSMKGIIEAFGFEWRMAPGEAEAELAYLNGIGVIDAVVSDDVDNFLFGAKMVIRNASATLSGNSKHATKNADGRVDGNHSTVYTSADILAHPSVQLTRGGLILIGLLSGGDYHQAGLPRCGPGIAHGLAKCGLGDELLKATQSMSRDELPDFLTTWREDLRSELRTNMRGHLGSKKPSLAKAVPDSFPDIDILLSYTNPIISATDAGARRTHTPPRWEREPDLGKLAHLCELHFEWGLKDIIIKRFRTIVWPSIVLRALRRSALEATAEPGSRGEREAPLQDVFGTPSKLLARHFSSMGFGAHDTGGDGNGGLRDLVLKIHSSRSHAYTDSILEYRLEVAPAQLVRLASAGIQGLRKPADTTYDVLPSESEDESGGDPDVEDTGRRRKKRGAGPPPEPDSHLRVWMPACMVRPALPELVERYEAEVEAKRAKKSKGKQRAPPGTKAKTKSPSKRKVAKPLPPPVDSDAEEFDLNVSSSSEDEGGGGSSPPPKTRVQAPLPATPLAHSRPPESICKSPTQGDQILDISTSDDDDAPGLSERTEPPLSSPSKVLQRLDGNLCGALPPSSAPSPSRERPPPTSTLRPFPMAFEEEESSDDETGYPCYTPQTPFTSREQPRASTPPPLPQRPVTPQEEEESISDDDQTGFPSYTLQTPFIFRTQPRASTPPPPPRCPVIPQEEEEASSDDPDMVIADLPVLADTRDLYPERATAAHPTSPRRRPSRHHPFPPPPAKEARKGGSDEGRVPRAETSIISVSSGGSDDDSDDGLVLAPLLIARSRTLVAPQRVVANVYHEVIDLT